MFSKQIIDSDAFLEMPLSSQALYFHLSMRADDDGFVNNPNKIAKIVGANKNDLDVLIGKRFILSFESGVIVIKHWRINNYLQNDRCKATLYQDELALLEVKDNKAYTEKEPIVYRMDTPYTQVSIDKNRLEENRLVDKSVVSLPDTARTKKMFVKPSIEEIRAYCLERKNNVNADQWLAHYEAKGWLIGKSPMKDWKAAVRTWETNGINNGQSNGYGKPLKPDVEVPWLDKYLDDLKGEQKR
jgi:hypothetical protein